ncbi:MAG TPA: AraC family transcriptional regulator [Gemmatimonadales bacterium]|nr:AraC family transcriptional regulator [Gemmatimonadales bacterium]
MSRTEPRESARMGASRDELAELIARHVVQDGREEAAPGLSLYRYSRPTGPLYGVSEPSFCVVVQGAKELLCGRELLRYDASQYLLVSAGLPVVGHVIEASEQRPYLAARLVLDPAIVTDVLMESGVPATRSDAAVKALVACPVDADLLDSVLRLVRLVDTPRDYAVLAPLAAREIVYRLARGDQGARLRQIAVVAGRAHRIAKAIGLIRRSFGKPLRIDALARQLGMSISGLHHDFKAVTAMSPLQFQKQLRLQEARRLLLGGEVDVARAGYRVGYEDPPHFNREYKKLFGQPPGRDIERLRSVAASNLRDTTGLQRERLADGRRPHGVRSRGAQVGHISQQKDAMTRSVL